MKNRTSTAQTAADARFPVSISTSDGLGAPAVRDLMIAVLDDAIHSLSSSRRLVRLEAEHWIASADHDYVFSFVVICETLDLEPKAVRASVDAQMKTKLPTGRLLQRTRRNVRHGGPIAGLLGPAVKLAG